MDDLMKFEEGMMTHICHTIGDTCQKEFAELGADINKLKVGADSVSTNYLR